MKALNVVFFFLNLFVVVSKSVQSQTTISRIDIPVATYFYMPVGDRNSDIQNDLKWAFRRNTNSNPTQLFPGSYIGTDGAEHDGWYVAADFNSPYDYTNDDCYAQGETFPNCSTFHPAEDWWQIALSPGKSKAFPIHGQILTFWNQNTGYQNFGPPISTEYPFDVGGTGSGNYSGGAYGNPGDNLTVQKFAKKSGPIKTLVHNNQTGQQVNLPVGRFRLSGPVGSTASFAFLLNQRLGVIFCLS